MNTLDSCTKTNDESIRIFNPYRGGVRVEDLINKFKTENKFDTMNKSAVIDTSQEVIGAENMQESDNESLRVQ